MIMMGRAGQVDAPDLPAGRVVAVSGAVAVLHREGTYRVVTVKGVTQGRNRRNAETAADNSTAPCHRPAR